MKSTSLSQNCPKHKNAQIKGVEAVRHYKDGYGVLVSKNQVYLLTVPEFWQNMGYKFKREWLKYPMFKRTGDTVTDWDINNRDFISICAYIGVNPCAVFNRAVAFSLTVPYEPEPDTRDCNRYREGARKANKERGKEARSRLKGVRIC